MNILIGVHHFLPRYTAGAEWQAYETAVALRARGHTVRVVCVERIDETNLTGLRWEDDVFDGLPVRRLFFNWRATPAEWCWEYDNRWIGAHLREWFSQFKPDLFHLFSGYLMTASALRAAHDAQIPTVVTLTDFWFLCRRISMWRTDGTLSTLPLDFVGCAQCLAEESRSYRWLRQIAPGIMARYWKRQTHAAERVRARWKFLTAALKQVNCVISPSQFLRAMHIQAGVETERIIYSRFGRDFANLTVIHVPNARLRLGYIGQIAELKGVHVALEAVRRLQNAPLSFSVYGNLEVFSNYAARLRALAQDDARITFRGAFDRARALSRVLADLDVLVVPSVWYENSPTVILEAFAHCVPVLAANVGGMAELVEHGVNGLLFERANAADLAAQIEKLLNDPDLVKRLRAGIKPVKTIAAEMTELEAIYQRVVNS